MITDKKIKEEKQMLTHHEIKRCIDLYYQSILIYINKQVQNIELAKDLTQDVFCHLMEIKVEPYMSDKKLFNLVYTIAHNIVMDYFRAYKVEDEYNNCYKQNLNHENKYEKINKKATANDSIKEQFEMLKIKYGRTINEDSLLIVFLVIMYDISFQDLSKYRFDGISLNTLFSKYKRALNRINKDNKK